jgi:hypothetical protein
LWSPGGRKSAQPRDPRSSRHDAGLNVSIDLHRASAATHVEFRSIWPQFDMDLDDAEDRGIVAGQVGDPGGAAGWIAQDADDRVDRGATHVGRAASSEPLASLG